MLFGQPGKNFANRSLLTVLDSFINSFLCFIDKYICKQQQWSNTMKTKIIKTSPSTVGHDPKNPLMDIHPDDSVWYFEQLIDYASYISDQGQTKEIQWEQLQKRRPKHLSKSKAGPPNSILTIVLGLLTNYYNVTKKYGSCRISRKQQDDLEFVSMFFHACDEQRFTVIQWQQALFAMDGGTTF
jgi:hypothetical protein|tara:strand:+ start:5435 stop:5986 length:552 start_codon:yes stop_codon:yes gene_type:complete